MRVERDTAHQESLAKEVMRTAVSLNTKKYYGHTKESMLRTKLGSFDSKSWAAVFVISRQRKAGQLFS